MKIILVSADGVEVPISREASKLSEMIVNCTEDISPDGDDFPIPCPNIESGKTLKLVVSFLEEYFTNVADLPDSESRQNLTAHKHQNLFSEPWVMKYSQPQLENPTSTGVGAGSGSGTATKSDSRVSKTLDTELLFSLMEASDFLSIEPLIDITCRQVSYILRGKSESELRKILEISDSDLTEILSSLPPELRPEDTTNPNLVPKIV